MRLFGNGLFSVNTIKYSIRSYTRKREIREAMEVKEHDTVEYKLHYQNTATPSSSGQAIVLHVIPGTIPMFLIRDTETGNQEVIHS